MKIIMVKTERGDTLFAGFGLGLSGLTAPASRLPTPHSRSGNVLLEQGKNL